MLFGGAGLVLICQAVYPPTWLGITNCAWFLNRCRECLVYFGSLLVI
jgi:hypothetical protein